jgi:GNAT superfamily N-acetyltransferase
MEKATEKHLVEVFELVQDTIKAVYPKYYPKEVADFFCAYHNVEKISADIKNGNVWILFGENKLVGTGSREGNHITRFYVAPAFQGKGYGSCIIQKLEDEISGSYDHVLLDASLPASRLYEKRGYKTVKHEQKILENDVVLVYEVMRKELSRTTSECMNIKQKMTKQGKGS